MSKRQFSFHRLVDQAPHTLRARWYGLTGGKRLTLVAAGGLAVASFVSSCTPGSNAYSMRARTSVLSVEPACGRSLVWDLPVGVFSATSSDAPPPLDEASRRARHEPWLASVRLAAGSRARIERIGDGELTIHFDRSPHFIGCAGGDAVVDVRSEAGRAARSLSVARGKGASDRIVYRSGSGAAAVPTKAAVHPAGDKAALEFVLPLEGRIVVGAELQHGAGWRNAEAPALLDSAEIQVRSLEGVTEHSVTLIEERVDAGSIVDSVPCFELGPSGWDRYRLLKSDTSLAFAPATRRNEACIRAMRSPALGLVRAHREGGMDTQVYLVAQHLSIASHQGQPRLLGVTLWHRLIHWHLVQALVAFGVLIVGTDRVIRMIYRIHDPRKDSHET